MKIACIGIGAVGSIIARELKVTTLHVDLYSRTGSASFTVYENDEYTTYEYPVDPVDEARNKVYDIIFIAAKATALKYLREIIPEMSHDGTEVVLCQNGMGYDHWFENGVPSVVYISGQKKEDHIEHFRDSRLIIQNEKYRYIDSLIKLIEAEEDIRLEILKVNDFEKLRYEKLLINLGVNTMTALSQNTARIFQDADVVALTRRLLKEGQAVINRRSHVISDDFIDESVKLFKSYPDHMGTSMYYDVMNETVTEYAFIQKYFYDNKGKLDTPVLDVIYTLLKGYAIGREKS
ncbi:ketopantoate reductase C-terminal domain-containing protein [Lacicoccus alkaliphilus]|uniref:2-dehydropantoate 2-reductase n=1 Tax=Lacicoccus alkaliphilus DSM 16010 TaxID=1123231 RepID=A0A1M7BZH2_9BACL|nr:ketopantoate reductase C-terminal domain-containing protein [Salinicoccus alkaliphilus]SHL60405.1 2-dehydropantoate 2-reductase [Salinicoccus alkaliphilus DSM 16010]